MKKITSRQVFLLMFLISTGLVAGGLYLAKVLHLAACPLCIIQRMLYLCLALVTLLGLSLPRCKLSQTLAALGSAAIAGTGAFVAAYQVWLQRFAHDVSCTADAPWWEDFVYWAGEQVPLLFKASGLCSDPGWKFMGLSIADYSTLAFSGLFVLAVIALVKAVRSA
jgi:disulfide bond formation protein DsbB